MSLSPRWGLPATFGATRLEIFQLSPTLDQLLQFQLHGLQLRQHFGGFFCRLLIEARRADLLLQADNLAFQQINLPWDGFELLAELRRRTPIMPIIVLTARASEDDKVRALEMGARCDSSASIPNG